MDTNFRNYWPYGLILAAVVLFAIGIISSPRTSPDLPKAEPPSTTRVAEPSLDPAPASPHSSLGSAPEHADPAADSPAPDEENAVIVAEQNQEDATLVLVRRDGEYPWVRMEVRYEYDPISRSEEVAEYNTFAGDRVRVVPKPGVSTSQLRQWATGLGAEIRQMQAGNAYEVIWPEVELQTLTRKMSETLAHTNLFNLIEPVDVEFDAFEIEVKEPLPGEG